MRTKALNSLYIPAPRLNQLNILTWLASDPNLTQAELARRCALSVAMVNNYMKQLCQTGLLEYRRNSPKSVSYHLTSAGEAQVEVVEQQLLEAMVEFFAQAKEQIRNRILGRAPGPVRRVILYGSGHLAELAFHALEASGVRVIGVCDHDPAKVGHEWCGRQILNPSQVRYVAPDAVVIVDRVRGEEIYHGLRYLPECDIQVIRLDGHPMQPVFQAGESEKNNQVAHSLERPVASQGAART